MAAAAKEALQHYDGYLDFFRKDGRLPELYGCPMLRVILALSENLPVTFSS